MEVISDILNVVLGVITVILTFGLFFVLPLLGCLLLFRLVWPRWKARRNLRTPSGKLPLRKGGFTQHEKRVLAEKIQESKHENRKKGFAGKGNMGFIVGTIVLILVTIFFVILAIKMEFRKY